MGSKKKAGPPPPKKPKVEKDRYQDLMRDVEKTNPDFVKWLRTKSGTSEKK